MKLHKEGILSIIIVTVFNLLLLSFLTVLFPKTTAIHYILYGGMLFLEFLVIQFFIYSDKIASNQNNKIISPAEGKIVVIEEIDETEYFNEKMIQVSIFMSIWDMHVNRIPISGKLREMKHFPGKHFIAKHPKSSVFNERNVLIIEALNGQKILVRQIAGIMARRIVSYLKPGADVKQGEQFGFIKFGSRVDLLIPRSSTINVKLGQKVQCGLTTIAELP